MEQHNVTVQQIASLLHLNVLNYTNSSDILKRINISDEQLFDFYEAYLTKEKEQLVMFKFVAYILGTLIILSNIVVVISSGLIIKKGQQPKSTYLLLGNVSLADTIIGVSIIFGTIVDGTINSNPLCIFQIGLVVCPTLVSIFSVGLIAVDRYIYILHGLYYQRWCSTTKVRIGIICTWLIGIILGFMPVTGWTNKDLQSVKCYYFSLFPGGLILINAALSLVPVAVVVILYSIILINALRNVRYLKKANKSSKTTISSKSDVPKLRIFRGNNGNKGAKDNYSVKYDRKNNIIDNIKRSASAIELNSNFPNMSTIVKIEKSKSVTFLNENLETDLERIQVFKQVKGANETNIETDTSSKISIWSVTSSSGDISYSNSDSNNVSKNKLNYCISKQLQKCHANKKSKEPNKWRAITVVMLTSGAFVVTWLPFFVVIISYVLCENKLKSSKCLHMRSLLRAPLGTLAYFNSVLNPLIYAWWHKGFKRSFKKYCFGVCHCNKK